MKKFKNNTTVIGPYLLFFLLLLATSTVSAQCDMTIYVTETGSLVAAGTKDAPTSLGQALFNAEENGGAHIKMAGGFYRFNNSFSLVDNTTIEGGYTIGSSNGNWFKGGSKTIITREQGNVEGTDKSKRLVAFYGTSNSNFRLQDLVIIIAPGSTSGHGTSAYGVVLTSCSDYVFSGVEIACTGEDGENGTNGQIGAAGVAGASGEDGDSDDQNSEGAGGAGGSGAGSNGGTGGDGAATTSSCCASGNEGENGDNATDSRSGGGGSGGGSGGQEDNDGGAGGVAGQNNSGEGENCVGAAGVETGCNSSSSTCVTGLSGGEGCPGVGGAEGTDGMLGELPSVVGAFLYTGGRGTNATDGEGGSGGSGGGGGAGESCFVGSDGAGAGGGGGGGGGEGGTGGTGGWSGGHSVALLLSQNGSNGKVLDCDFNNEAPGGFAEGAGAGGAGGTGGAGGAGGLGGAGGGDASGDFEIGCGGTGGAGGAGGTGGTGGAGRPGEIHAVHYVLGGSPLQTSEVATGDFLTFFNLSVDDTPCTNRPIHFTGLAAVLPPWTFGSGAMPADATGTTVSTTYTTLGTKTITYNGETFANFITIAQEAVAQASFTTTAPQNNGTYTIATGSSINFDATDAGEVYSWNMGGGATPNTFEGAEFKELNNITFNTEGTYTINLIYKNECCGDSEAATLDIVVSDALPISWSHLEARLSRDEKSVWLDWGTVSEENNRGFEIWRSNNSRNWEYLAFVNGAGTSNVSTDYTYEDEQPGAGRSFYRLVQVDFDGTEHMSQIVDVLRSSAASLGLYPNPTKGILNITGVPRGASYQVRNSIGQLFMAGEVTAEPLQIGQLIAGVYYLVVGTEIQRFIVQPKG